MASRPDTDSLTQPPADVLPGVFYLTFRHSCLYNVGMSYTNQIELLKLAVQGAIKDRASFIDAISNCAAESEIEAVKADISRMRPLLGIPFREAMKKDSESVRLAFIYGEQYFHGLADIQVGMEKKIALGKYQKLHSFRVTRFGKTPLEAHVDRCDVVNITGASGIFTK